MEELVRLEAIESLDDLPDAALTCDFCFSANLAVWRAFTRDAVSVPTLLAPPKPLVCRYACRRCIPLSHAKAKALGAHADLLIRRRQNHQDYARLIDCLRANAWRVEHNAELQLWEDRIVNQGQTLTPAELRLVWDLVLGRSAITSAATKKRR